MTSASPVQQHPASVDAYIRQGWSLVPIPSGTKGPRSPGWNRRDAALRSQTDLPPGYGIGLAHAYSGTMALDVDAWDVAVAELARHGIDLGGLYGAPDAVVIDSGRQGHGKLLYAMPFGLTLPSRKLMSTAPDGSRFNFLDFRCATAAGLTVQDVLPPSIHPDTGQPYRWAGLGHWTRLPVIPDALLDLWRRLLEDDRQRTIATDSTINASWIEIRQALEHISADVSRDEWITVGMALHWAGTQTDQVDEALHLWNEWSATSAAKYPGPRDILTQWASFRADKATAVKLGSLFHLAAKAGWQRPAPDISGLFPPVTEAPPAPPATILQALRPAPPDIDITLWPKVLADRAQEISTSVGCDPLVPLFAGLAAVCGVIDARSRLEMMPGFQVPPVLWLMTLGEPADKKSPGSRPMLEPLKAIELEDRPRWQKEFLAWECQEAAHVSAKKSMLEHAASPEFLLGAPPPAVPELPPQPVPLKITVSDITSQKLVRHAAERPRGLLCYLDEMHAWVKKLTDRSSGEDRSAWVSSYEAQRYEMDRVGAGSIHAENLAVSIYGNIQPRVFRENIAAMDSDGLLQRFIPAVLRADRTRLGDPMPEYLTTSAAWENLLRTVYALSPTTYTLTPEAHRVYREFQHWYEATKADERLLGAGPTFMTAFGKIEGTAGRLALLWHVIERPFSPRVEADTMAHVIAFVRGYLVPSYRYAFGEVGGTSTFEAWVTEHVIHYCDQASLTLSEIKRSARRPLDGVPIWQADAMVLGAMQMLEQVGWVARMDDGTREHQHFAQWAINPALKVQFAEHRARVIAAKQRQLDEIYKLSTKEKPRVYGAS